MKASLPNVFSSVCRYLMVGSITLTTLQDNRAEVSEAHDDVHGDGRAQVISIQTQVPGATARK